jgi:hypothetical protein
VPQPPATPPTTPPATLAAPVAWLRHHPRDWRAGTIDVAGLSAAAGALAARPGFEAAMRHFADGWQAGYDATPVLGSVMRNNARYVLLLACLWLDHQRDPGQPGVSITPGRLLEFYARLDHRLVEGGSSRIKTILAHARTAGLLQPCAGHGDMRLRPLEPTPLLRRAMAGYVQGFLSGIAPTLPLPVPPQQMVDTPGFVPELFSYRMLPLLHERFSINQGLPALTWITNREKGYPQLLSLVRQMHTQPDGQVLTTGWPQQIATRVGVSRNSARNFLLAAVEQGWLAPAGEHRWALLPGFHAELLQWMGREFLWMHTLAVAAWRVCAGVVQAPAAVSRR